MGLTVFLVVCSVAVPSIAKTITNPDAMPVTIAPSQ